MVNSEDLPTRTLRILPYGHPSVREASACAEATVYTQVHLSWCVDP